ncbi:RagB/SusD family nutrient uptake outer membrane protein [Bacteroidota bacterium]
MKKYIILILSVILTGMMNSCDEDFLTVYPTNTLTDGIFWKTDADAYQALVGCYSEFRVYNDIVGLDVASDNCDGTQSHLGNFTAIRHGTATPQFESNFFSYTQIRKYNNFLDKVEEVDMDQDLMDLYKAEVRFLRAYDYFFKAQFYGDMPLLKEVVPLDYKPVRDPVSEINQFILDECEAISADLPVKNYADAEGRVTAGAALALKARLELYLGMYSQAMTDAKRVIDMGIYELHSDYETLFYPGNETSKEIIFAIGYLAPYVGTYGLLQRMLVEGEGGWSGLGAPKALLDAYETADGKTIDDPTSGYDPNDPYTNRDPRMYMHFVWGGKQWNGKCYDNLNFNTPDGSRNVNEWSWSGTPCPVIKWVQPGFPIADKESYDNHIICFRLAEMYLTYAEAAAELNQNTGIALGYINDIRARAGMPAATTLTKALIQRERRIELAFEGLRYLDIKRFDLGPTVLNDSIWAAQRYGTLDPETCAVTLGDKYITVGYSQFRPETKYLFPIPQSERDITGLLQNDGY